MKPIARGKWRLAAGMTFFRWKRYVQWTFGRTRFAHEKRSEWLRYVHYSHQTILLRPLQNVEMWMQHNKVINLRLAIERLNGLIIHPGETFSYWKQIGKPTRSKGYVEGKNELYRDVYTLEGEWLEQEWLTQNRAYLMYEPLLPKG
ncbi:VanW family protein [Brevibacillus sp. MER 51]|uniref:VanW family protein n=1 Tax=Brevibacillus sp. MER 51 TaxID=2939560 RepID=UPI00203D51D6|nr:VanW family protein [Brevibacillus sp. MER 51]MCM3144530.1 VanW family protein [Brevibacillus sp. MER 51]